MREKKDIKYVIKVKGKENGVYEIA